MPEKNSTPLYQEALLEVKKIKELTKKEVERELIEKFSPIIDKMLDKEISGVPVLLEQEDPTLAQDLGVAGAAPTAPAPPAAPVPPPMPATAPLDATVTPPVGDMATAGITPAPAPTGDVPPVPADASAAQPPVPQESSPELGIPIPGPDGKITVDIEALFSATPEGAEPNVAAATITPPPTEELSTPGSSDLPPDLGLPSPATEPAAATGAITESFGKSLKALEKEIRRSSGSIVNNQILQNKLFALYEVAQNAKENKEMPEKVLTIAEATMELLFTELKKTSKQDNSYKSNNIKEEIEMGKKDFRTLKEFASSLFAEEVEAKGHAGFGDGDAAKEGVKNTTTLKDETAMKKSGDAGGVEDPGKKDSLTLAEGSDDEALEADLMEMIKGLDMGEGSVMPTESKEMSVKKEAIEKKLQSLKEKEMKLKKELQECGMMGDGSMGGAPVNVNLKITVDKEGGVSDVKVDGDDAGPVVAAPSDESGDSDDLDIDIVPDEDEDEEPSEEPEEKDEMIAESKLVKQNKQLRQQLAEQQLLTAVSIYVNKLFSEHNLSVGTKQKIVKYIDSAQTIQEAKAKYEKVKGMLAESNKPTQPVGSSSKPAASSGGAVLAENAMPGMNLQLNPNRWMQLAGIKPKST